MIIILRNITLLVTIMFSHHAIAQEILATQKSWDGSGFSYPTQGEAKVTAVRITLKENERTPDHCHPVPVFGYMLRGTIEVTTSNGKTTTFAEGDAIVEVMNIVHAGRAIGGDAEILAIYAGSTELPNTIIDPDSASFKTHCQK